VQTQLDSRFKNQQYPDNRLPANRSQFDDFAGIDEIIHGYTLHNSRSQTDLLRGYLASMLSRGLIPSPTKIFLQVSGGQAHQPVAFRDLLQAIKQTMPQIPIAVVEEMQGAFNLSMSRPMSLSEFESLFSTGPNASLR
jgi:hypothetical protein